VAAPRIWVLLARKAQSAVVFRRGPAKRVLVLRWDTARDAFEEGQWLSGRIYERRCDLSPSGELLVYFAAKWKGPHESYTAVSRPPWLTALALWDGFGAWGGGGLFQDERTLELNQRMALAPTLGGLPRRFRVLPFGSHPVAGEDSPIWHVRLLRDGWTLAAPGAWHTTPGLGTTTTRIAGETTRIWWRIDPPMVYRRVQGSKPGAILEMRLFGIHEIDGPWYAVEHAVLDARGRERASLGRADWADFDAVGDLLFARDGRIHRVRRADVLDPEPAARVLVDLGPLRPTRRQSPAWARNWGAPRPRG
jgi:hypothetical protein